MADVYADVVATLAFGAAASSLGWQVKIKWWDRPNIVLTNVRISAEMAVSGQMGGDPPRNLGRSELVNGCTLALTASNTGDAQTTVLDVRWELDYGAPGQSRTFVAGTTLGPPQYQVTDARMAGGELSQILAPDDRLPFAPIQLERNQSASFAYRIGLPAMSLLNLRGSYRMRPLVQFVDRKRRLGPPSHGPVTMVGDWLFTPRDVL